MTFVEPQENESWVGFWKRQNDEDENGLVTKRERKKILQLYCQSCCYRYPDKCLFVDTLHPYDRAVETCPDFVAKDLYKGKARGKCLRKRLEIEPEYQPLPDGELRHPIYGPFALCNSWEYYMIVTKEKAYKTVDEIKKGGKKNEEKQNRL